MAAPLTEPAGAGAEMQRPVILTGLALIGLMTWQLAPDGWRIVTLFGLGAVKVRITGRSWLKAGLETLWVGGLAAAAAYGVGRALAGLGG